MTITKQFPLIIKCLHLERKGK